VSPVATQGPDETRMFVQMYPISDFCTKMGACSCHEVAVRDV
jgi:hypothetical protein